MDVYEENIRKREMNEMRNVFKDYDSMIYFKEVYVSKLKMKPEELYQYGWESVADDISEACGQSILNVGEGVEIEISSTFTASGNPELIPVGELVEIPVPDPEMINDSYYLDETGYIGDYVGDYKFKN